MAQTIDGSFQHNAFAFYNQAFFDNHLNYDRT